MEVIQVPTTQGCKRGTDVIDAKKKPLRWSLFRQNSAVTLSSQAFSFSWVGSGSERCTATMTLLR